MRVVDIKERVEDKVLVGLAKVVDIERLVEVIELSKGETVVDVEELAVVELRECKAAELFDIGVEDSVSVCLYTGVT